MASRPQFSAATVAANGVDFLEPLKPALPADPHTRALPRMSVMVMSRLLNVAEMWAMPSDSTTFLPRFGAAALAGADAAAGAGAAAGTRSSAGTRSAGADSGVGFVITSWSLSSYRRWRGADP